MKLKLNKSLRRALYSSVLLLGASTTTLSTAGLLFGHFVSYNLQAQSDLSYTGSNDVAAPSALNWSTSSEQTAFSKEGEASSFTNGDDVSFVGHTDAILEENISVGDLTVAADGSLGVSGASSLSIANATLNNADVSVTNTGSASSTIGAISGTGSLTLSGNYSFSGDVAYAGDITLVQGTTSFGTGQFNTQQLDAASITIQSGAQFTVTQGNNDLRDTDINLSGGRLHSGDLDGADGVQFGTLTVSETGSMISHQWNGVFSFEKLTGSGDLALSGGNESGSYVIEGVENFNGMITRAGNTQNTVLRLSGLISQESGNHMVVQAGTTNASDLVISGAGAVTMAGTLNLSGDNVQLGMDTNLGSVNFAAEGASYNLLGGQLILDASEYSGDSAVLRMGDALLSTSLDAVSIDIDIELGAHDASVYSSNLPADYMAAPAGYLADPVLTTIDTFKNDMVTGNAVTISGSISDVAGGAGGLKITGPGSVTLSGNNTFSGGISLQSASLTLASSTAAGTGTITVDGGSLDVGGQSISNRITYSSGSISGMGAFTGWLEVETGTLSLDAASGDMGVATGASLTLTGAWDFAVAIHNEGSVTFDAGMTLDLAGAQFINNGSGVYELYLVRGAGSLSDAAWLSTGALDMDKISGVLTEGRDYSYSNGVLSYMFTGASLEYTGSSSSESPATLDWATGALFDGGSSFSQAALVTFSGVTTATLGEDISVNVLDLEADASLRVEGGYRLTAGGVTLADDAALSVQAATQFSAESLTIGSGASAYIDGDLDVQSVSLSAPSFGAEGDASVLEVTGSLGSGYIMMHGTAIVIASDLGSASVLLNMNSELRLTETFAAGEVALDGIRGDSDSLISINLAEAGNVLSTPHFYGSISIGSGMMDSSIDQVGELAGIKLGADTTLRLGEILGANYYSINRVTGESSSTISVSGSIDEHASSKLGLAAAFTGKLQINEGVIDVSSSSLGGTSTIVLNGGGVAFKRANPLGISVSIVDGTTGSLNASESVTGMITGAVVGAADTTINKSGLGTIVLNNLTGYAGAINIQEGHLVIGSDATLAGLGLAAGKSVEVAQGGLTVSVSEDTLYTRNAGSDTITVGENSTLKDNVYLRLQTGTVSITGGGTYEITKFMGADYAGTESVVNIAADTTLRVTHDVTSGDSAVGAGFMLGHWGSGANTEVNVAGTLELYSGISNKDGTGVINVEGGGSLILRQGLYAADADNHEAALTINVASGASVQLYNQANATAAGVLVADFAGSSTIQAMDATTSITNTLRLSGTGDVTLSAHSAVNTVNVNGSITAAAGSSAGLAITGSSTQTFNLNAANSYAGDTSITGASVVVGNAQAFGVTGSVTVHSGSLDLNDLAVSNRITAAGGSLSGFSAYTGSLDVTGSVSGSDLRSTMSVADSGSLTLSGTWFYDSAIINQGAVSFDSSLELDLTDASFSYSDGSYSLNLMTGSGSLDASLWLTAEGAVDVSKLTGILTETRSFSYDAGVLSYTTSSKDLVWTGGNGSWSAEEGNAGWLERGSDSSFASRDIVNFEASSTSENSILLVGDLEPLQVNVNSEQNYSFEGTGSLAGDTQLIKDGSGTLTIRTENSYTGGTTLSEGTLRIQNMNALGTGELEITGGTLSLFGGSDVTIQNLNLSAGVLNIALESTDGTLNSGASIASHALNVTGSGTFTHDKWSQVSSVNVGEYATVYFNETNANSTVQKTISGAGKILVGHTDTNRSFYTQFDATKQFSGTFEMVDSGRVVMDIDHSSADYRSALILGESSELVITANAAATLHLDGLSGKGLIRFDWNSYAMQARNIDIEMTADQNFEGSFMHGGTTRMGNFIIGSAPSEHHTFTFSGAGMVTNETNSSIANLVINNATVAMTNDAVWNSGIQLTTSSSVLHFNGNATTRAATAGTISGDGSVRVSADTTLNGANTYSNGTSLTTGTLTVGHVSALGLGVVTVDSGTLNLAGLAVANNVTAAGGNLLGFSAYTGELSVTGNVSVADSITGDISITDTGSLTLSGTWDFSEAMENTGTLSFADSLILDITDFSFDADNSLTLFTGGGSANIDTWLTSNSADLGSHLLGVDMTDKKFSYNSGVLSYRILTGDLVIDTSGSESVSGLFENNIFFTGDGSGTANLSGGFSQGASSVISGEGNVVAAAGGVTLSNANTYTGDTFVGDGATLIVAHNQAMGASKLQIENGGKAQLADGVAVANDVRLTGTAEMTAGVFTLGAKDDLGTAELGGATKQIAQDSITGTTFTGAAVALSAHMAGSITDSTLTRTAVTLGEGSTLTMENVHIGTDSTVTNANATAILRNSTISASSGSSLTSLGKQDLPTLEHPLETRSMEMFSLTHIDVATLLLEGSLTLNLDMTDAHYNAFDLALTSGIVGIELDNVDNKDALANLWYGHVTINVSQNGTARGSYSALGSTWSQDGSLVFYVPEPSTATLSLLALAGLLVRRRRQKSC